MKLQKNGIWSNKIICEIDLFHFTSFLDWTFLNFLAPCVRLKPKHIKQLIAKADTNGDGFVDREEFIKLASDQSRYLDDQQQNVLKQYLQVMAYAEEYRFWPPPWFILSITLIQIILFILNHHFYKVFDAKVAQCSYLIFR